MNGTMRALLNRFFFQQMERGQPCPRGSEKGRRSKNFRRKSYSRTWLSALLLFGGLLCFAFLQVILASDATIDSPENSTVLEFLDGSALHGTLRAIDSKKGLRWEYDGAKQPLEFKPENLAWLRFPRTTPHATNSDATCQFQFANGDEFFGKLLALNESELELQTWFGGKFKTPRTMARSIRFFPKGAGTIYEGPTGMEGWQLGKNPNSASSWQYRDGAFLGNSPGTLGRDLNLPDASRVEFDLNWSAPFSLLFSFYTGVFDGFNYNTSCYMFFISPGNISLQRINTSNGSASLGRSDAILPMLTKKKAHLEFRGSKEENFLEVLVDGKSVNQWKDNAGWAGKGSGILFYTQSEGAAVKISNLKVSEWDGRPGSQSSTNALGGQDELYLVNRDKVSGKVMSLRDGKIVLSATAGSLEIPLQRVTQILFSNADTNVLARGPWEIQASVAGGGTISFALEKWDDEKVLGRNKTFGIVSLNSRSIRQIQFNPDKAKPGETDSANDILWEIDEK